MKINKKEVIAIIDYLEKEKGIDRASASNIIKEAFTISIEKNKDIIDLDVYIDSSNGVLVISSVKEIVLNVKNHACEISLDEVKKTVPNANVGEYVRAPVHPSILGRSIAHRAWQILKKKIDDESLESLYKEYRKNMGKVVNGSVIKKLGSRSLLIDIGKIAATLPDNYYPKNEFYSEGDRVSAVLLEVVSTNNFDSSSGSKSVILSRNCDEYVTGLLSREIPEISDGTIQIMGIARSPGIKTKILAKSNNENVDVIGSCIGNRGSRIARVISDLKGERVEIIPYSENKIELIRNMFSKAGVKHIILPNNFSENKSIEIITEDDSFPLAVGKFGVNARLASKLLQESVKVHRITAFMLMIDETKTSCLRYSDEIINQDIEFELVGSLLLKELHSKKIFKYKDLLSAYNADILTINGMSIEKLYFILKYLEHKIGSNS